MKLSEFAKKEKIEIGTGFPQGDTFLDLNEIDVEKSDYEGRPTFKITYKDQIIFCPKSVIKQIMDFNDEGIKEVRVTRVGKSKEDTKYTVIGVDKK